MNQIAGVDGFNIMNDLRLVIIVALFISMIIVLLLNWILGARRRVKRKYMQAVNPHDDSSREDRLAPGAVDDFLAMEESMKKEKSKGGESTDESEVEIEGQPVVNYEKIEADLKTVRDEITTKIEGLILKVEAIEKTVLNKIEDVIDAKIQEASNKINDSLTEVLRIQKNSVTSVSEERVDSTDTIAPSGEIEEKISEGDLGESVDFDIQKLLEEDPVGISFTEESREVVEEMVESKKEKERDLELPDEETIAHEGIDEKEIDTITPLGDAKEKALELAKGEDAEEKKQSTGKTVDFDIQKFLEELGTLPSEKG